MSSKYENGTNYTFPEIFILSVLGVFIIITMVICFDTHRCVKQFLAQRKRIQKALQYRPSSGLTIVTPVPGDNREDIVNTPSMEPGDNRVDFTETPVQGKTPADTMEDSMETPVQDKTSVTPAPGDDSARHFTKCVIV